MDPGPTATSQRPENDGLETTSERGADRIAVSRPAAFLIEVGRQPHGTTGDGRRSIRVRLVSRSSASTRRAIDVSPSDLGVAVIGASLDWDAHWPLQPMAAAVTLTWDRTMRHLAIRTSILGLPPIYLYRRRGTMVLTSDLSLLASWPGVELRFDPKGIEQFCRIGHPVGYRTLFEDVSVLPGGLQVLIGEHGDRAIQRLWRMPDAAPLGRWEELIELQAALFRAAVERIPDAGAFLSLTGGLDSRAILAILLEAGRPLPALTMGWGAVTLDARLASTLCQAYGIPHETVAFDASFATEVADHALTAARLTGGLAAVEQATEVAFYERIGARWRTRVSGYLGNQVGRAGHEQLSLRHGDVALLDEAWTRSGGGESDAPTRLDGGDGASPHASAWRRVLFASLANYGLGHHFMDQVSPYATRALIESLARLPAGTSTDGDSILAARLRDLRHRFTGEPIDRSFQRRLVASLGGPVASQPINWGWRAGAGVSLAGLAHGSLAAIDAAAVSNTWLAGLGRRLAWWPGITGRHSFRQPRHWWSRDLLESLLLDQATRGSGLFHIPTLRRRLDEHFSGRRDHLRDLLWATDLALAFRVFLRRSDPS